MEKNKIAMRVKWSIPVSPFFTARVVARYREHRQSTFWLGFDGVPRMLPQLAILVILLLSLLWSWPQSMQTLGDSETKTAAALLLEETAVDTTLTSYDQALQFALSEAAAVPEGGTK